MSRQEHLETLEKRIEVARLVLDRWKAEAEKEREALQHEEIEQLEKYLEVAHPKLTDLKTVGEEAWHEIVHGLEEAWHQLADKVRNFIHTHYH